MKKGMKKFAAAVMAVILAVSGLYYTAENTKEVAAADEYQLVWSDEFNGTALDRSNWNVEVNGDGGGNWEHQYYLDSPENIEVSDGTLKITALKAIHDGKDYTSGRINTKKNVEVKYGRIEARMKMPSFTGAWPAFWMLGSSYSTVGWPACGEIDIMEAINTESIIYGTVHWSYNNNQADSGSNTQAAGFSVDRTQWHTYALEWNENSMTWYVDDKAFFTQNLSDEAQMQELKEKHFIIFNLAVGGTWPGHTIDDTAMPATMEVDYVRVYQKASDNGSLTGNAIPEEPTEEVPTTVVYKNGLENKGAWEPYFGSDWAGATGSGTSTQSDSFTLNISSVGNGQWGIQSTIRDVDYTPGNTYTYSFTMTSDITKNVIVKVVGEDSEDDIFSMENITLQAGIPYNYSKDITIPSNYKGRLDFVFGIGGGVGGENISSTLSTVITMTDALFMGDVSIPLEIPTTSEITTDSSDTIVVEQTTTEIKDVDSKTTISSNVKKPAKVKIKKITKKKKSLKIKIKKVKSAKGYQVRYSTKKKFKKYKTKNTKRISFKLKKLKSNKKYYIKVRAYVLDSNGKRVYGKFSKVKKAKTKS